MNLFATALHRFRWLHAPVGVLMVLLQRTPVLRVVASAGETSFGMVSTQILRSAFVATAMGAYNSVAGATKFSGSATGGSVSPASSSALGNVTITGAVGTALSVNYTSTGAPSSAKAWSVSGTLPAGLSITTNNSRLTISGTPTTQGTSTVQIFAYDGTPPFANSSFINAKFEIGAAGSGGGGGGGGGGTTVAVPAISKAPIAPNKGSLDAGSALSLSVVPKVSTGVTYQWKLNNANIDGATSATYSVASAGPANSGSYTVTLTNTAGSVTSKPVVVTVFGAPATLPVGGTLAGTVNFNDTLDGASTEVIDLDFAAKTIRDNNDPASKITYAYKRTNATTGVITAKAVWTGTGKEKETTTATYTLVFGTYNAAAASWPVTLSASGKYSGKDAAGKAYAGSFTGSGTVTFVK